MKYSLEDGAKKLKKDISVIENWESGEDYPTYNQLEKLAYEVYQRPLALFFSLSIVKKLILHYLTIFLILNFENENA
jgi:transcriptional regulator with XRE-family HTH domain